MRWPAVLLMLGHLAAAEELAFPSPAAAAELAFPLGNGALFTRSAGHPKQERLPLWTTLDHAAQSADPNRPGFGFAGTTRAELIFDWLDAPGEVTDYQRRLDLNDGLSIVTFKRGGAGFTWTTFVSKPDDLLVLHLRADKPGFLGFRVQIEGEGLRATVEDRRMLSFQGKDFAARAWIYPMESEVTPGEHEITVRGEGEALILLAAASGAEKISKLRDKVKPLGFGGAEHPDLFGVWTGLLERQRESSRKVPGEADFSRYLDLIRK